MSSGASLLSPPPKEPRDLRYRRLYFPHADGVAFDTTRKGFVPLPILLRKLMRHLSAPELRSWCTCICVRASTASVPDTEEIAFELGLQGTKNLAPYIKSLESKRLISTKTSMGRKFYLVHDPESGFNILRARDC